MCFQENDIEEAKLSYMKYYSTASEMKLGIFNFDGFIDLRQKMLSAGPPGVRLKQVSSSIQIGQATPFSGAVCFRFGLP